MMLLSRSTKQAHRASAALAGYNLEVAEEVTAGLLADRLRNAKLLGPAHPTTGLAPEWFSFPRPNGRFQWKAELTRGLSLSGFEAQFLGGAAGGRDVGMVQTGVWVRAGEELEIELWALAQSEPAALEVGVRPPAIGFPPYASAIVEIDAPHWLCYRRRLAIPADDPDAELYLRLSGDAKLWIDQVHLREPGAVVRPDVLRALRELRPSVIRFPGGCLSTVYRWRHGVGPVEERPTMHDPIWMQRVVYDFGTDEYLQLCLDLGATPHVTVTVGGGTREEAVAWAVHCREFFERRGLEPPTMYWQIGNEQFGHWEVGAMSAARYADLLADWVPRIRDAYPRARIIGLGPTAFRGGGTAAPGGGGPWREVVLRQAAEHVDVLAVHFYGHVDGAAHEPAAYLTRVVGEADALVATVAEGAADAAQFGKTVALTEWALWSHGTSHGLYSEPDDGAHAVFIASVLNGLLRLGPAVELAELEGLLNWFGAIMVEGPEVRLTLNGEVMRWYRDALPADVVPVVHGGDVDAVALRRDGAYTVLAVNRSATREHSLAIEGPGSARAIRADGPLAQAVLEDVPMDGDALLLPPCSVTSKKVEISG